MTVEIICADARDALAAMPEGSVHACITSPPYWGLRDYGLEPVVWGDAECEHEWGEEGGASGRRKSSAEVEANTQRAIERGYDVGGWGANEHAALHIDRAAIPPSAFCRRCSAWRGALGLEPTPELYVEHIVQVMRKVKRVLRDDATLWLNIGDSYASGMTGRNDTDRETPGGRGGSFRGGPRQQFAVETGLKPKDLCGMPWRVAFAIQADGWWLRSDIVWSKPNPMPESVTDRPTRSHEYLFLLSKSARYYYDQDAIREPSVGQNHHDLTGPGYAAPGQSPQSGSRKSKMPDGWATHRGDHGSFHRDGREAGKPSVIRAGRNRRSVWEIATQPFGMEMCSACKVVYDAARYRRLRSGGAPRCQFEVAEDEKCGGSKFEPLDGSWQCIACDTTYTVKGLQRLPRAARCACGRDDAWIGHFAVFPEKLVEPCILAGCPEGETVLDPFAGSGTVGVVAERLGRHSVLIDASEDYCQMARERTAQRGLMVEAAS